MRRGGGAYGDEDYFEATRPLIRTAAALAPYGRRLAMSVAAGESVADAARHVRLWAKGAPVDEVAVRTYMKRLCCDRRVFHWADLLSEPVLSAVRELKNECMSSVCQRPDVWNDPRDDCEESYEEQIAFLHLHLDKPKSQAGLAERLVDWGVLIKFPVEDLIQVWKYVQPIDSKYAAHLPCRSCLYSYPPHLVVRTSAGSGKEPFWQCRGCVEDGGIAYPVAVASVMSQFPLRPQCVLTKDGRVSNRHRPYFDVTGERIPIPGKKEVRRGGVKYRVTMAGRRALYERRQEVQAFGIKRGMGPYRCGTLPDGQLHDEYLWVYRFRLRFTGMQRPFYCIEQNRRDYYIQNRPAQYRAEQAFAAMEQVRAARRWRPPMEVAPAPAPARVSRPRRYGWSLEDWDEDVECSTPARPVKRVRLVSKTRVSPTEASK